jgi:hypothetical protein
MSDSFYRLLGMTVWKGAKFFLRRKYGPTYMPRPVIAGLLLAVIGALVVVLTRRESSS